MCPAIVERCATMSMRCPGDDEYTIFEAPLEVDRHSKSSLKLNLKFFKAWPICAAAVRKQASCIFAQVNVTRVEAYRA